MTSSVDSRAFLEVHAFTPDGILVPCEMRLVGSGGGHTPHSSQDGRTVFAVPPGDYELVVNSPGFAEVRQPVNVSPLTDEVRQNLSYSVSVTLQAQVP